MFDLQIIRDDATHESALTEAERLMDIPDRSDTDTKKLELLGFLIGRTVGQIERQAKVDEARPADVIVALGAAEYNGRPSPVLRARLNHAESALKPYVVEKYSEGAYSKVHMRPRSKRPDGAASEAGRWATRAAGRSAAAQRARR